MFTVYGHEQYVRLPQEIAIRKLTGYKFLSGLTGADELYCLVFVAASNDSREQVSYCVQRSTQQQQKQEPRPQQGQV